MDLTKRVGMNIRAIRKSQNLTIDELAEKCDFQSPYLSDVERGERNITLQTLNKILDALEVEASSLLIPNNTESEENNSKSETISLISHILSDKSEQEINMVLTLITEIFAVYKSN